MSKICINIKNPIKTWKYVKGIIKKPIKHWHWGRPLFYQRGSWLSIESHDIQYKMKYDEPRFEFPPFFHIIFFHRWGLTVEYVCPSKLLRDEWHLDEVYWQVLVRIVDLDETLPEAATNESGWTKNFDSDDPHLLEHLTTDDIMNDICI